MQFTLGTPNTVRFVFVAADHIVDELPVKVISPTPKFIVRTPELLVLKILHVKELLPKDKPASCAKLHQSMLVNVVHKLSLCWLKKA